MKVKNQDVAGLCARLNRFITELSSSASANVHGNVSAADQTRLGTYLSALVRYHDWVEAAPELDLPKTHPTEYEITGSGAPLTPTSNESVNDVIRMLESCRAELAGSQSAQLAAGLTEHDSVRFSAIVEKAANFLTEYIAKTSPLDQPESAPAAASS